MTAEPIARGILGMPSEGQARGLTVAPAEISPIVGHHAGWGLITSRFPVRPFTLTAGGTDTMRVRVREKIDIHGIGTDVVEMVGAFVVRRDHPRPLGGATSAKWGQAVIRTEFRSLELYGESPLFGTVRVRLDPAQASLGEVGAADPGSQAAKCIANIHPMIELPELGMALNTGDQPVRLASKVVQVPPVGDVARSEASAPLKDQGGKVVGELVSSDIEVGDVLLSTPLGATERRTG